MIRQRRNYPDRDEYYTTAEEVEYIFTQIIDTQQLRDKIVYCPCDSDESEFTKWLENHKVAYGLKEFIHTSDDFNTHEDLFEKADFIITNPPFSKIYSQLLPLIKKHSNHYFLFGNLLTINRYLKIVEDATFLRHPHFPFITPFINRNTNDYFTEVMGVIYMTNMKFTRPTRNTHKFLNKKAEDITLRCNEYLAIDKTRDYPYDHDGCVYAPYSFVLNDFIDQFEYSHIEEKYNFSDGNGRFARIVVKRKPEYVGQKFI